MLLFVFALSLLTSAQDSIAKIALQDTITTSQPQKLIAVSVEADTVFFISANFGSKTASERAEVIAFRSDSLLDLSSFNPELLEIHNTFSGVRLLYDQHVLFDLLEADTVGNAMNLTQMVGQYQTQISAASAERKSAFTELYQTLKQFAIILIILVFSYLVYWGVSKVHRWFAALLESGKIIKIKGLHYRNIEVLNQERLLQLILLILKVARTLVVIILIYLLIPTVFSFFPQTREIATTLFSYILRPLNSVGKGFFLFVPDLILIVLVVVSLRYIIRFLGFWSKEIAEERTVLKGFHSDWATPTFNLIRFFLILCSLVIIIQLLPGSNTPLFLGFLAFLALTVALASAKPISNFVSGILLTYMRAFKVGDRVKVEEASGIVTNRNLFVTRIKTKSNEYITIPNSKIMDAHVVNYSSSEQDLGLVVYCDFWLDSKIPYQKLQDLLVEAALRGDSIVDNPKPTLIIKDIEPGKVRYKLNAYTLNSGKLERIKSSLYKQIKSTLQKEGIEI